MSIYDEILIERARMVADRDYSAKPDDAHTGGQLACAGAAYALAAGLFGRTTVPGGKPSFWPWHAIWWKPGGPRLMLLKAAALCVAEIERLDRQALSRCEELRASKREDEEVEP